MLKGGQTRTICCIMFFIFLGETICGQDYTAYYSSNENVTDALCSNSVYSKHTGVLSQLACFVQCRQDLNMSLPDAHVAGFSYQNNSGTCYCHSEDFEASWNCTKSTGFVLYNDVTPKSPATVTTVPTNPTTPFGSYTQTMTATGITMAFATSLWPPTAATPTTPTGLISTSVTPESPATVTTVPTNPTTPFGSYTQMMTATGSTTSTTMAFATSLWPTTAATPTTPTGLISTSGTNTGTGSTTTYASGTTTNQGTESTTTDASGTTTNAGVLPTTTTVSNYGTNPGTGSTTTYASGTTTNQGTESTTTDASGTTTNAGVLPTTTTVSNYGWHFQLIGAGASNYGLLQVTNNGEAGYACGEEGAFTTADLAFVCNNILGQGTFGFNMPPDYFVVNASENYNSYLTNIGYCNADPHCDSNEFVNKTVFACTDALQLHCSDAMPVNMRFVDGDLPDEGRVEVYFAGEWGQICNESTLYDTNDAMNAICRSMGYSGADLGKALRFQELLPVPSAYGPLFVEQIECEPGFALNQCTFKHLGKCDKNDYNSPYIYCI